jgi:hypothetical protein
MRKRRAQWGPGVGLCGRLAWLLAAAAVCGCSQSNAVQGPKPGAKVDPPLGYENGIYRGFDRNDYTGDAAMAAMHQTFAFTGYWLTNPPGEDSNTWVGKRATLRAQGWGFLVLANGRLDEEILKAQKQGTQPAMLAQQDAAVAATAARREGFPPQTIIFVDQEEGGGMLDEQAAYLLAWTEAIAGSGFRAGIYRLATGIDAGGGKTITTIDDLRARVQRGHLHPIAFFDAQDACPPAPGCSVHPKPLATSGELDLTAWQYAQSPQRKEITKACTATYAKDGNCYAPGFAGVFLDMDAAASADPSQGR